MNPCVSSSDPPPSARSFTVPNYPHTFKWRRSGSSYHVSIINNTYYAQSADLFGTSRQCTTTGVKGAVATLDAAVSSVPPRLQVFETLLVQDSRPQLDRGGVSLNLLDHLLVTALLLVTDAEEWVTLAGSGSTSQSVMSIEAPPQSAPASVRQWRKIVYGEPLFPSLRSPDGQADSSPLDEGEDEARPGSSASRPASMRQWRKIVYGEPLFPSLPNQDSPVEGDEPSRSSTPWDDASQSSESVNYPSTPLSTGAPAHGYIDPSFYDSDVPPVPELPTEFKSYSPSPSLRPQSSRQSSSVPTTSSTYSGSRRELPRPPGASTSTSNLRISTSASASTSKSSSTPLNQTWLHRSRSTPFLNNNVPPLSIKRKSGTELSQRSPSSQRAESPVLSLGGSRRRRLPPTPQSNNVPGTSPPVSIVPIRARTEKRRPNSQASSVHRTLPPTPVPRVRPSTSSEVESAAEQYTRQSMEKEANELSEWVQSLTIGDLQQRQNLRPAQTHHEAESAAQSAVFDAPPPAYNAIDFSHPPHASAPPPGDSSEGTPHPCASPIPTLPHSQLSTEA